MNLLQQKLLALFSCPVVICLHENRSTYLRAKKICGMYHLHVHKLFVEAPTPVLEAIVRFCISKDVKARHVIRQMVELYFSEHQESFSFLSSEGKVFDLQKIYEEVKIEYFEPDFHASIGFSRRLKKSSFRSMTFGSYHRHARQITIHPLLDHPEVPLYFLKFIVYHEMLHAVCPCKIGKFGKILVHTAEFRRREKLFVDFSKAKEWQKQSLTFFKQLVEHGRT